MENPGGGTTMLGGGRYDRHATVQATAAGFALPLIEQAAAEAALPPPASAASIAVADYGSATGKNSLEPVGTAVRALRARDDRPLMVFHVDQPGNDFGTLLRTVATDPASYARHYERVFPAGVARSFYQPVLPAGSLSVAWSSSAAHWLSAAPGPLDEHLWSPTARHPAGAPVAERARGDWRRFLGLRAAELRPGGQMVVVVATVDDEGLCGGEHVLDGLDRAVRRLVAAGAVSREEHARMVVPCFFLSRAELEAPFADPELSAAVELIDHARTVSPDLAWSAFELAHDAGALAASFVGWLRGFSETCLFGALDPDRPADGRHWLADQAYGEVEEEIRRHPEAARSAWRMAALRFRRR